MHTHPFPGRYRHWTGHEVDVICVAVSETTPENVVVVYQPTTSSQLLACSLDRFTRIVGYDGRDPVHAHTWIGPPPTSSTTDDVVLSLADHITEIHDYVCTTDVPPSVNNAAHVLYHLWLDAHVRSRHTKTPPTTIPGQNPHLRAGETPREQLAARTDVEDPEPP